ncbi:MAG: uroporphyrinogen decarboxylase [Chloroflexi bacterium]|nr:uroporphyrinogen decarboxylase [Chloroflexota bacterium]
MPNPKSKIQNPKSNARFLRACCGEPVDRTPVWLMRQAGRFLPEYRALREKYSMMEMLHAPELAVEATLQPVRRFEIDAAIIFADILPILTGMGLELNFVKGAGPVLANPIRRAADVTALRLVPPDESLPFVLEAIRLARRELEGKVPLIGFSGAPFTLASYAIEGGGSKNYTRVKALMYGEPDTWHLLMEKLTTAVGDYLAAQVEAGAQTLQLFDSWAGALSPSDYARFVLPYNRRVTERVRSTGVPFIYFSTGTSAMLPLTAQVGSDVVGVDWRIPLDEAWDAIGTDRGIQGNLDPALLATAPPSVVVAEARRILREAGGRPGHIFNLGHGVLPQTPLENVQALVEAMDLDC